MSFFFSLLARWRTLFFLSFLELFFSPMLTLSPSSGCVLYECIAGKRNKLRLPCPPFSACDTLEISRQPKFRRGTLHIYILVYKFAFRFPTFSFRAQESRPAKGRSCQASGYRDGRGRSEGIRKGEALRCRGAGTGRRRQFRRVRRGVQGGRGSSGGPSGA